MAFFHKVIKRQPSYLSTNLETHHLCNTSGQDLYDMTSAKYLCGFCKIKFVRTWVKIKSWMLNKLALVNIGKLLTFHWVRPSFYLTTLTQETQFFPHFCIKKKHLIALILTFYFQNYNFVVLEVHLMVYCSRTWLVAVNKLE